MTDERAPVAPEGMEAALRGAAASAQPIGHVADTWGIPRRVVYTLARRLGITAPRPNRPGLCDQVVIMDAAGHGVVAIAGHLGISAELANYHLRSAGVPVRRSRHATLSMASALRLYAVGASWEDIERRTGVPKSALRTAAQRTGVRRPDRRPMGPAPLAPHREPEAWMTRAMVDYLRDQIARMSEEMAAERDRHLRERAAWPALPIPDEPADVPQIEPPITAPDIDLCMEVLRRIIKKHAKKPVQA